MGNKLKDKACGGVIDYRRELERIKSEYQSCLWELDQTRSNYQSLFNCEHLIILLIDPNPETLAIIDANDAACKYYGYTREELVARGIFDINILPQEEILRTLQRASSQETNRFTCTHRLADGQLREVEMFIGPVVIQDKPYFHAIVNDITERVKAQRNMNTAYAELNQIFNTAADGMRVVDKSYNVTRVNDTMLSLLQAERDEVVGKKCYEMFPGPYCRTDSCPLKLIFAGRQRVEYEVAKERADGSLVPCIMTATPFCGLDGELIGIVENFKDISYRKSTEEKLRKLSRAVEQSPSAVIITDANGVVEYVNPKFERITGYLFDEVLGRKFSDLHCHELTQDEQDILAACLKTGREWRGELQSYKKSGEIYWGSFSISPITAADKSVTHFVMLQEDITERKKAEDTINFMAYHDPLTGLANRKMLDKKLKKALIEASNSDSMLAVMFLDLDKFKNVNDTLGHDAGDRLLQMAAKRLEGCVRSNDTVARMGGDEFILLLRDIRKADDVESVADKILQSLELPFIVCERKFIITGSIGIALFPDHGGDAQTLLKHADQAMYVTKSCGRDTYCIYRPEMNGEAAGK